jgi:hypothetical protein
MKLPTEAELIEVEQVVLNRWQAEASERREFGRADRIVRTLETLIAIARDPSRLLDNIPLDDALNRAMEAEAKRWEKPKPAVSNVTTGSAMFPADYEPPRALPFIKRDQHDPNKRPNLKPYISCAIELTEGDTTPLVQSLMTSVR